MIQNYPKDIKEGEWDYYWMEDNLRRKQGGYDEHVTFVDVNLSTRIKEQILIGFELEAEEAQ